MLDPKKGPVELKMLAAGTNYLKIMSMLTSELIGYFTPLPRDSFVSVHASHPPNRQTLAAVDWIAEKKFDVAIGSPTWMLRAASEGRGARGWGEKKVPLRALAVLPHHDMAAFAIRREFGITSFRQLMERKPKLRLTTARLHNEHTLGWLMDSMFEEYGMEYEDIERWGGSLDYSDRQPNFMENVAEGNLSRLEKFKRGLLDGIFDEAIMVPAWKQISDAVDLNWLPVDEDVLERLEKRHGARRTVIKAGRFRGVDRDIPTLEFGGWCIYCHADLPDEMARLIVFAIDRQKKQIEGLFQPGQGLSEPIDMTKIWQSELPLHPGAEQYYRERGYMK